MRVFGWSDGGSGCEFYRLRVPLERLALEDPDFRFGIGGMFDLVDGEPPDVVIGQRVNQDGPTKFWNQLSTGELGHRPRLIYEIDDDLFNVAASNPAYAHFTQPSIKNNIRTNMLRADAITVSTAPLMYRVIEEMKYWGSGANPPVHVIPNCLPDKAYRLHPKHHGGDPIEIAIGWAGSSSHAEDFEEVLEPLARHLRRDPRAVFHSIGAHFPRVIKKLDFMQYRHDGWFSDMSNYYSALDAFDVGIIPLRPSVFNQSKSDVKFLEYAARQIPVIASDTGPYQIHKYRALVVDQPHQWERSLRYWGALVAADLVDDAFSYALSRHIKEYSHMWRSVLNGQA